MPQEQHSFSYKNTSRYINKVQQLPPHETFFGKAIDHRVSQEMHRDRAPRRRALRKQSRNSLRRKSSAFPRHQEVPRPQPIARSPLFRASDCIALDCNATGVAKSSHLDFCQTTERQNWGPKDAVQTRRFCDEGSCSFTKPFIPLDNRAVYGKGHYVQIFKFKLMVGSKCI